MMIQIVNQLRLCTEGTCSFKACYVSMININSSDMVMVLIYTALPFNEKLGRLGL